MRIILTVVLFVATSALAQQSLKIKEPVGSQLSPGSVQPIRSSSSQWTMSQACLTSMAVLT
jgi:hypothetical protein